ncbi:CBM96 family carbohydrate-binding protein [Dyadobacter flavalbus]|uniref:CBM96 family carbohydrate-binding protein n=1 Tax=Dyadobacter flavalbus TaxID=2579942 RepID=UPI0013757EFA|nr:malectin domain-containing carbohydrate-binding protein [Dyadobacter flavalbus]
MPLTLLVFFFLSAQSLSAQSDIQWDRTIGGRGGDGLYLAQPTKDGGYILGGMSGLGINGDQTPPGKGKGDYWVVKVSATGAVEWDKVFGGSEYDELNAVQQTPDGGYILGGNAVSDKSGDKSEDNLSEPYQDGGTPYDYWIVKISANGTKEWDKTYGGIKEDFFVTMKVAQDGGYIIGGGVSGALNVLKLAADGSKIWERNHRSGSFTSMSDLLLTPDGGYLIGGSTPSGIGGEKSEPSRGGNSDYWILKIDANGVKQWDKTFGSNGTDTFRFMSATSDKGYLLLGHTSYSEVSGDMSEPLIGGTDTWVIKIKADGTKQWDKTIGASKYVNENNYYSSYTMLTFMRENADGSFLLGGNANGYASKYKTGNVLGAWTIKLAANGSKISDKSLGVPISEFFSTPDGGFMVLGASSDNAGPVKTENSRGSSDGWVIKYAPSVPASKLTLSNTNLSFTYKPGSVTAPQTVTLTASAGTPDLTIIKSDNAPWLKIPQAATGPLTFSIDGAGLAAGTYTAAVTLFAPDYSRAVVQVKLLVISEEANNTIVRINAGGPDFTTATKKRFVADQYYAGIDRTSSIASGDILNTSNDILYQSARCSPSFSYNIPVANGTFDVYLHFAETYFGAPGKKGGKGSRQFHVNMEGNRKLTNYDIFAKAGGAMRATAETFTVDVTDGMLNIDFLTGAADLPRISAIEVLTKNVMLKPLADSYIYEYGVNYGSAPTLEVKTISENGYKLRYSYLKFPIGTVSKVGSAKLRLYGHNHENNKDIYLHAYGVDDDSWVENEMGGRTGITNTPPASTPSLGSVAVNNAYKYYEIDVTSYVKAQQQAGDPLVSFMLRDPNKRNTRLTFNSKENGSNPPQLMIIPAPETNAATRIGQEEISVASEAEPEPSSVYPNPVKKQFTVQISGKHSEAISLDLLNNAGKSYPIATAEKVIAGQKAEVDISGFSLGSGIYMLRIKSETATEVIKVLVTE